MEFKVFSKSYIYFNGPLYFKIYFLNFQNFVIFDFEYINLGFKSFKFGLNETDLLQMNTRKLWSRQTSHFSFFSAV